MPYNRAEAGYPQESQNNKKNEGVMKMSMADMKERKVASSLVQQSQRYCENVDISYAYNLAKKMEEVKCNELLGYRTAGSKAEKETGHMLYREMIRIGLKEVVMDPFTLDAWEYEKAKMQFTGEDGQVVTAILGGYQVNFDTKGPKEFEAIYAGRGTRKDLASLDVKGKLLLVDINQADEWWINYPAMQAKVKKAAGILAVQKEGFSEASPDVLNANDICGPANAPALSISQRDANALKAVLKKNHNRIKVMLDVKSVVTYDGTAYNVSGKILGKDRDSYILLSAHYDSYFAGFQDDNAAVGMLLGIAQAIIKSGYVPERTIIFNALAAEEWGVSDTKYDWSCGAYNQIFRIHPEWGKKSVVDMNFELPAYEHKSADEIRSVYELVPFLEEFVKLVPTPKSVYPDGVKVVAPVQTWADDYSFSIGGVPALRNDFLESSFSRSHYHTQLDNMDTYDEEAYRFHHILYGMLVLYFDQAGIIPYDFGVNLSAMKESVDECVFRQAGIFTEGLFHAIEKAQSTAKELKDGMKEIRRRFADAKEKGQKDGLEKQLEKRVNESLLKAFKFGQDRFNRLNWEDEQKFPHEVICDNLKNLYDAKKALERGEASKAVEEYLSGVDNNWYACHFDKEVYDYFTNYVIHSKPEKLMWGAGRIMGHVNLFDTIDSLLKKTEQEDKIVNGFMDNQEEYKEELSMVKWAISSQEKLLKETIRQEIKDVRQLEAMLADIRDSIC